MSPPKRLASRGRIYARGTVDLLAPAFPHDLGATNGFVGREAVADCTPRNPDDAALDADVVAADDRSHRAVGLRAPDRVGDERLMCAGVCGAMPRHGRVAGVVDDRRERTVAEALVTSDGLSRAKQSREAKELHGSTRRSGRSPA